MKSSKPFLNLYAKKLPIGFIVLLILFAGAILIFTFLAHQVLTEKEEQIDLSVFQYLETYILSDGMTRFMRVVTYFASAAFLQIAYGIVLIFYLIRRDLKRVLEIAVIGAGGFLINYTMKLSFRRVRPEHPLIDRLTNFSFPSGHATGGFIFYGLLVYLLWKSNLPGYIKYIAGSILILFSFLIGFSRIYLRVHYTSDVIAGFCCGFAWLCLTIYLMEKLKKKSDRELTARKVPEGQSSLDN